MSRIIYLIATRLYLAGIYIASAFNGKARSWVRGRRGQFDRLEQAMGRHKEPVIWMHCASLGEFEQGRPVLEALKKQYPNHRILLSFFSPSGYELRKNYTGADWVCYLPMDGPRNARRFLELVRPELVLFVKYEYWYFYLKAIAQKQIPLLLISAIFRPGDIFFTWYGGLHRQMVRRFSQLFVQNESSARLIRGVVPDRKITIAGDTRFDRVLEIAGNFQSLPLVETFVKDRTILVAGSSWPDDEENLRALLDRFEDLSLIIAPHEINDDHLNFLKRLFAGQFQLYSQLSASGPPTAATGPRVLIIDNIGMLSRLYFYADLAYIGGGFNRSGIHNTLEAAVYGKPVLFGPHFEKFAEAIDLTKIEAGFSYTTENELVEMIYKLKSDPETLQVAGKRAAHFVQERAGATPLILDWIRQNGF
ncbi:glycosyltransferase N-terminal domain-containing protein [Niabella terrae]